VLKGHPGTLAQPKILGGETAKTSPMTARTERQVKVRFELEQDEDGWPPLGSEGVWATPLGDESNSTTCRGSLAAPRTGDRFRGSVDEEGMLWLRARFRGLGGRRSA
jgi:hypothetical protein